MKLYIFNRFCANYFYLSKLFIEEVLNVCILGPSDSGKTFLTKNLGVAACEKYHVNYCHCSKSLEHLVAAKSADYTKYLREIKKILGFQLLILDDFLLNPHARTLGTTINETAKAVGY